MLYGAMNIQVTPPPLKKNKTKQTTGRKTLSSLYFLREGWILEGGGASHVIRTELLIVLFRVKKRFWYLLGCSAFKGAQQERLRYLLGFELKKMTGDVLL